ncbi:hypothetical protein [Clostridium botulinum]
MKVQSYKESLNNNVKESFIRENYNDSKQNKTSLTTDTGDRISSK